MEQFFERAFKTSLFEFPRLSMRVLIAFIYGFLCGYFQIGLGTKGAKSPLKDKMFVVIGAGGAGKALAFGAKVRGARVTIANRNFGKFVESSVWL